MFNGFAAAAELSSNDIRQLVNRTNIQIEQDIRDAQLEADKLMMTDVKSYNAALNHIIKDLIDKTNSRAEETMEIAEENGFRVECELIEVVIGDRTILIDPLRVVGI
jgi:hypothetical protein